MSDYKDFNTYLKAIYDITWQYNNEMKWTEKDIFEKVYQYQLIKYLPIHIKNLIDDLKNSYDNDRASFYSNALNIGFFLYSIMEIINTKTFTIPR